MSFFRGRHLKKFVFFCLLLQDINKKSPVKHLAAGSKVKEKLNLS